MLSPARKEGTMNEKLFIGYGSLAGLLDSHPTGAPLFLSLNEEQGQPGQYGVRLNTFALMVSDIRDGHARYCRMVLGRVQTIGSNAFDTGSRERTRQRALSAYWLIEEYIINRHGFPVESAMIAMPRDLKLLDGWADFLRYDKEADRFVADGQSERSG